MRHLRPLRPLLLALVLCLALVPGVAAAQPAAPVAPTAPKVPTAAGGGGAAATVDELATRTAVDMLAAGGNAVDAAVAAAAVLGVTEPYSCGIGGGGFLVAYLADEDRVVTIDHRETAPNSLREDSFLDAAGQPIPFGEAVTSGLGVGVPGTVRGWQQALSRYGTITLRQALQPAIDVARSGFVVDQTFASQTEANLDRFADFSSTRELFLDDDGTAPDVGSVLRNPDLADTYRLIARRGADAFYRGPIARDIVTTVNRPPLLAGETRTVRPGGMDLGDLAAYAAPHRPPATVEYRGLEVAGMGPPSSGGSTVGEALNILEGFDLAAADREEAFHLQFEAAALAFADRNAYVGDADYVDVPLEELLSDEFAAERRALIGETALPKPVAPGVPDSVEGESTTHLTVADDQGNVVSYTFTIESTGGSGIAVPGRGFLLNNELTDFNFVPGTANSPAPGKRPRSSMSPTIVLRDGEPVLAVGSPGGATIITTVLQILVDDLDLGASGGGGRDHGGGAPAAADGFGRGQERAVVEQGDAGRRADLGDLGEGVAARLQLRAQGRGEERGFGVGHGQVALGGPRRRDRLRQRRAQVEVVDQDLEHGRDDRRPAR
jgi:gamma-glutamyltranspeptidase/glutathione hydrolase